VTTPATVKITVEATHDRGPTYLPPTYAKRETGSTVKLGPFTSTRKTAAEAREQVAQQLTTWAAAVEVEGNVPVTVSFRGWTTIGWLAPDADGPSWQTITVRPDGSQRGTTSRQYVPRAELDASLRLSAAQAALDPHDAADVSEGLAFVGKWGGTPHEEAAREFARWVGFQCAYVAHRATGADDQAAHDYAARNQADYAPAA
jgi:hypothetical protein